MGVQFEWQTGSDDGQWETIARTERDRWLRRIPRWVWIVLVAVLVVSAGGGYVAVRRRYDQARREIEFQIQSVIDLEARAFAQGDEDLFLAQQDDQRPDWYSLQKDRIRTNAQDEPILPAQILDVDLRGDVAWVEVVEGEGPVRRARFYRQTDLGWKHTEPRPEFWGTAIELRYGEIIFRYHKRDQPHVDPLVEHIAQTFFDVCAQVGCPEGQSLVVNFAVDAFIPVGTIPRLDLERDEWLIPSPWLLGLPVDGIWDEALLNELTYAIAGELASQAMSATDTFAIQGLKSLILNEYVRWYSEGETAQTPVLSQLIERQGEGVLPRVFDQLRTAQDTGSLDELIADTLALSPTSPGPAFFETLLAIEREAIFAGLQEIFLLLQDDETDLWIAQQQAFHEVLRHGLHPTTPGIPDVRVEDVVVVDDRALVTLRAPLIRVQGYAPQSLGRYAFFTRRNGEWKHSSTGHAVFWDISLSQFYLPLPVRPISQENADEDVVTITFLSLEPAQTTDNRVEAFEEQHPHIRINVISEENLSFPDLPADTQEATSHLYQIASYQIASLADVTLWFYPLETTMPVLLYDLTPFMAQDATFDRQDFYPGMLNLFRWGDRTWALPVRGLPFLIYYDRNAFDEAGLPYPRPGWTQEEFASLARQLAVHEGTEAERYGFVNCSGWPIARAFVEGQTGPLVDALTKPPTPELNEPRVVRAVRWYTDLALEGIVPKQTSPNAFPDGNAQDACYRLVEEAKAAMWADVVYTQEFWMPKVNLGVVPFPTGQYPANPWYAYSYAMSGGTLYPEESWLWLRFLSQHYGGDELLGLVPARRSAAETADYWSAWDSETAEAIQGAMEHAWAFRLDAPTAAFENAIVEIHAGTSVQRALNEAQVAVTPR